ncbi:MAG TPA: Hint domain-containing protein [Candidatus Limnocylindria bacterium]|jgi:hypothetical protein|nr:Hint domain-containing protein [Candidatus Limnocylindria bacterium]
MGVCALVVLAAVLAACGGGGSGASPTPSAAPTTLGQAELKYRIVDQFGRPIFCDPDFYPVARFDEQQRAHERLPEMQKDPETFAAIATHLGVAASGTYTAAQELAIYRDWKMLNALELAPALVGFRFSVRVTAAATAVEQVEGTIDAKGALSGVSRTPSGPPPCPICLARGTRIATPNGDIAVEALHVGDVVWTRDASGARVAAPLVAVGTTRVPPTHRVVRLVLSDGRAVDVSPGHPTADGRRVGDLAASDAYEGAFVVSAARVPYAGGATFDILPAGATGAYWANGVLIGSTLR